MTQGRDTTVLFADVTGSTKLYEEAGDRKAADAIGKCLAALRGAAEANGGRIIKNIGDEVMAVFPNADRAAQAAARMHSAIRALPPVSGHQLGLRIGFHTGPVLQRDGDLFGDTVNLASRLASHATKGQVLLSQETVSKLSPLLRDSTRRLYDITVKGKADDVALCELLWLKSPDITVFPGLAPNKEEHGLQLRLRLRDREVVRRRLEESISVGRDADSAFVITDTAASRHHCVIERRQNHFVLRDHSTNGTYVAFLSGEPGIVLRRAEFVLRGRGWISFGQPRDKAAEVLEYSCEQQK